jgi:hypothetical protein
MLSLLMAEVGLSLGWSFAVCDALEPHPQTNNASKEVANAAANPCGLVFLLVKDMLICFS